MARRGTLVAGVDCSTQATKVLVIDPDLGETVAAGSAPHTVSGTGGARETDPNEWWTALRAALKNSGRASDVGVISVAGQQHGLVVLDERNRPLRRALLWNDTRSSDDAERLTDLLGPQAWVDRTGLLPRASFTVTKWAWLRRNDPATARAAASIRLPHDYLTQRLAGAGVTDRGDASGTGWWSPGDGAYDAYILGLPELAIDPKLLPAVLGPLGAAGEVTIQAASDLGLPVGAVVGPGTGDNMAAALGLGLGAGQAAISLGTSGTVFAVSERRSADPTGIVAGFADATGRFLPLACTLNCTLAVDRVAGWLRIDRDAVEPSNEVVALPYFDGERTPALPQAPATLTGLRHSTTRNQILMAVYEGAAASLVEGLDAISAEAGGADLSAPLMLIGGGARGATWREVIGRLTGRPLFIPDAQELVALGAAVQATAVWRGEDLASVAMRWGTDKGTFIESRPRDQERLARIRTVRDAVSRAPALSRPSSVIL